jgi:hypothetical protein
MRCGTTSLHRYLDLHPEIQMSDPKEPGFFGDDSEDSVYPNSLAWYRSLFDPNAKVRGEASANYTKYPYIPDVPRKMHALVPDAKLVYLVRHPLQRILSHYAWEIGHYGEQRTIEEVLSSDRRGDYVCRSSYWQQIEQYLAYYAPEQMLVIRSERLFAAADATMQEVLQFLAVRTPFYHPDFGVQHYPSAAFRRVNGLGRWMKAHSNIASIRWLQQSLEKHLPGCLGSRFDRPRMSPSLQRELIAELSDDINALQTFTGWDLSAWRRPLHQ